VSGPGFRFEAPAGWTVATAKDQATASRGVSLARVTVYPLLKAYAPAKFPAVTSELDSRVAQLASQLPGGRVVTSATTQVAGMKVRSYRLEFRPGRTEELAFVLRDRTEYLLLCRRRTSASDTDCAHFFASFALR